LSEGLQKNLLSCFFDERSLSEKSVCHTENSWTVSSNNLCKGGLVAALRLLRQFEVQGVFKTIGQKRSSSANGWRTL
jgi:hypothetical protein